MKRCPHCGRVYTDNTLNFCLDDGQWLTGGNTTDESPTAILSGEDPLPEADTRRQFTITEQMPTPATVSRPENISGRGGMRYRGFAIATAAVLIAAAAVGTWVYRSYGGRGEARFLSLQSAKLTRATNSGQTGGGAISRDGRYLAHVVDDGGQQSLWLKQTAAASNVQIVPPAAVRYSGTTFSPDGDYIYYAVHENGNAGTLYQVPVLGGQPRKLLSGINSGPAFSPDGGRIAFFRVLPDNRGEALMLAKADGSEERELAVRSGEEGFFQGPFSTVSWSPDGRSIATPIRNVPQNYMTVAAVSVQTGELKPVTDHKWFSVRQVSWLPDSSAILLTGTERSTDTAQIWQILYPSGEASQISNDLNGFFGVGLTENADTIATVQGERRANLWVAPAADPSRAAQITSGRGFYREIAWTPDGRIVFATNAGGNWDLFLTDASGTEPRQLTTDELSDQFPAVTPDGRSVIFMSDRSGPPHIWRMDIDGSNQMQLTREGYNLRPQVMPDGRSIIFESSLGEGWSLWKIPIEGGQAVRLTNKFSAYPAISPDGKQIAANYSEAANAPLKLGVFSADTGELIRSLDSNFTERENILDWTPDGQGIVYSITVKGVSNLWAQPAAGGPPKQITNFTADRIFWFKYSRDGKQLALSRGTLNRDIVLIRNFR